MSGFVACEAINPDDPDSIDGFCLMPKGHEGEHGFDLWPNGYEAGEPCIEVRWPAAPNIEEVDDAGRPGDDRDGSAE